MLLRFALVLLTAAALVGSVVARKVDVVIAGVCGLLALVAAEVRFAVRPELFTRMSKGNIFAQHITELASPLALDENPRRHGLTVHFGAWASLLVLAVPAIVALYLHLVNYLLSSNNWTVVYYDSVGVVFVRKEGPNGHLPPASLPLPIQSEQEQWAYLKRIEIRPSVIDSFSRWLLGGEELPLEKEQIGAFLLKAGRWAEAERPLPEAAVEAPNLWETLNNLG